MNELFVYMYIFEKSAIITENYKKIETNCPNVCIPIIAEYCETNIYSRNFLYNKSYRSHIFYNILELTH